MIDATVVLRRRMESCPLRVDWRNWDIWNWSKPVKIWVQLVDSNHAAYTKTQLIESGDEICNVEAEWETAADDASHQTPPNGHNWMSGYPRHNHIELRVGKAVIHIDCLHSLMSGPSRGCTIYLIYLNGRLAGAGWYWGCTLGMGFNSLPAKALVGEDLVLMVESRREADPKVSLRKRGPFGNPAWIQKRYSRNRRTEEFMSALP